MGKHQQSADNLLAVWNGGLVLSAALDRHVPVRRRRSAGVVPRPQHDLGGLPPAEVARATVATGLAAMKQLQIDLNAEAQRRQALIDLVLAREFDAIGFLNGQPEFPVIIPVGMLQPRHFDWNSSTIEGMGRKYLMVRICSPLLLRQRVPDVPASKMGRPRIDELLHPLVAEMLKAGAFEGQIGKQREALIRNEARQRWPHKFPTETMPSRQKIIEALQANGLSERRESKKSK